jgi:hypothetical protein
VYVEIRVVAGEQTKRRAPDRMARRDGQPALSITESRAAGSLAEATEES